MIHAHGPRPAADLYHERQRLVVLRNSDAPEALPPAPGWYENGDGTTTCYRVHPQLGLTRGATVWTRDLPRYLALSRALAALKAFGDEKS